MDSSLLSEFRFDWLLAGKAERTVDDYLIALHNFVSLHPSPQLSDARAWVVSSTSNSVRRKRGQAIRAFGKWCDGNSVMEFSWWRQVGLAVESQSPQCTATQADYSAALKSVKRPRDKAAIELLWSCGLRRSELAALEVSDLDFDGGFLVVRRSKTGRPRIVPMSPAARKAIRPLARGRTEGSLLGLSPNAIRLMLQRHQLPSAHAWRRGWAVESLRSGISEASVRTAAGWSSGAMVARYTSALAGELAIDEFVSAWSRSR